MNMSGYVQTNQIISIALAADYTISVADTGKTFIIGTVTGARIMNLPQLQSGLHYRFILGAGTGAGNTLNIISPNALTAYGVLLNTTAATITQSSKQVALQPLNSLQLQLFLILWNSTVMVFDGTIQVFQL